MIQLSAFLWGMAIVFGIIGFSRGLSRELVSLAGIVLALFALFQFDRLLRDILLANVPTQQKFVIQSIIFLGIVFFAYQSRAVGRRVQMGPGGRDSLQSTVLGALVGILNGYLIWGTVWYFMDINGYPLSPFIAPPAVGSPSAETLSTLPLYWLAGGPAGDGNLLSLAVIVLFVIVLILI